jgi:crotonobetaine/carnitine-CoA ligase
MHVLKCWRQVVSHVIRNLLNLFQKEAKNMVTFGKFDPHFPTSQWNLPAVLEYQAEHRGDKSYLRWTAQGKSVSYKKANELSNRVAHGFLKNGIKKGDRIVFFMNNCPEFFWAWFGASKIGAVIAPINTDYKGAFLEYQINNCEAEYAVVAYDLLGVLKQSEDNLKHLKQVFVAPVGVAKDKSLPAFKNFKVCDLKDLDSGNMDNPGISIKNSDLAAILYTSGTEGPSKGVMKLYGDQYFFAEEIAQLLQMKEDDIFLAFNPLFHQAAQGCGVIAPMLSGGETVFYDKFSASEFSKRAKESGATTCLLLGGTMTMVYKADPRPEDKGNQLDRILAIPTVFNILDEFKERFGVREVVELYGTSETNMGVLTPMGHKRPAGAAGALVEDWYEIKIVDPETDEEVPVGTPGEYCVRNKAPYIMCSGYYNMPEKSLEVRRNLWYHTGDALKVDENGWYYFVDRVRDSMRRFGHNISSFEVESAIALIPEIKEVAVVAAPSELGKGEDELKACVVLKQGAKLEYEAVIAFCEKNMPEYFVPRYVEFIDAIPYTPTGKMQKYKLRGDNMINEKTWDRIEAGCLLKKERERREREKMTAD